MKYDTTIEVLEMLGFDPQRAEELGKGGISTKTIIGDNHIVIDGKENIVYSGIEGARKYYFKKDSLKFPAKIPDLFDEYYNLKLEIYVKQNESSNLSYDVLADEFYSIEKIIVQNEIEDTEAKYKVFSRNPEFTKAKRRYLKGLNDRKPDAAPKQAKIEQTTTFLDFIQNVEDKDSFANDLKNAFTNEKGKNLSIMYDVLNDENIMVVLDQQLKLFHTSMKNYFNRDIATYEAFRKAGEADTIAIDKVKEKLTPLINKHKTK